MTWFRVDDRLGDHPKVRAIPRAHRRNAMGLWVLAGSWCAANVLATEAHNGNVPSYMLDELCAGADDAARLVRVALWHAHGHPCGDCPQPIDADGWIFHQWESLQYTAEKVREKHAGEAERARRYRERKKANPNHGTVTREEDGRTRPSVSPVPSRPVPSPSDTDRGLRTETYDASRVTARPEDARCTAHTGVLLPPACRGCMLAREKAETALTAANREAVDVRRNCPRCQGGVWIEGADGDLVKCDHRPTLEVVGDE